MQTFNTIVSEPEPGRVLVETYNTWYITTFTVDSKNDGKNSYVTFTTEIPETSSLLKKLEFFFSKQYLPLVYRKELENLAKVAAIKS
jgi:hypothetical protein